MVVITQPRITLAAGDYSPPRHILVCLRRPGTMAPLLVELWFLGPPVTTFTPCFTVPLSLTCSQFTWVVDMRMWQMVEWWILIDPNHGRLRAPLNDPLAPPCFSS